MKKFVLLILTLVTNSIYSQNFISYVEDDTSEAKLQKHNLTLYMGFNGFVGNIDSTYFENKQDLGFQIGLTYEYRINKIIGLSLDLEYLKTKFNVKHDSSISFPINSTHEKYQYGFSGVGVKSGIALHIPRNKCASSILFSTRLYGFSDIFLSKTLTVTGKLNKGNNPFASEYSIKYSKLDYVNTFVYGVGFEISKFNLNLGLKYYINEIFDSKFINTQSWPQLPKFNLYLNILFS